jgi:RNA polymerase sigma-70 factor, ECF subfamily
VVFVIKLAGSGHCTNDGADTDALLRPTVQSSALRVSEPVSPAVHDARFRGVFEAELDFVWRSLRRLGVPSANVDDATQEVFLVMSRRLDDIELGKERSFLFGTALRVASTARRTRARHGMHEHDAIERLVDGAPTPEATADRARARAVLDHILDAMELDLRAVFVLYELEEMTMAEIATTLDLPAGTVASRLRRARAEFDAMASKLRGAA